MSDFEMLSIVLMILSIIVTVKGAGRPVYGRCLRTEDF